MEKLFGSHKKMLKNHDRILHQHKKMSAVHKVIHGKMRSHEKEIFRMDKALAKLHDKLNVKHLFGKRSKLFDWDDFAQQIVGALIVSLPFVSTEEVWLLAKALNAFQVALLIVLMLLIDMIITHYTNFSKVSSGKIFGIPLRVISLIAVSYGVNIVILSVIGVFGPEHVNDLLWGMKLVILLGFFSSIGASTVDLVK